MLCDLGQLDAIVRGQVLDRYDHMNLNESKDFAAIVPTTENLTLAIQQLLSRAALPAHLEGIRIEETGNNSFEAVSENPSRSVQ